MSGEAIDIRANASWPSGALSNFAAHAFMLDAVACSSMEGFLQGLKVADPERQLHVCRLVGDDAKAEGQRHDWSVSGNLWWRGVRVDRFGEDYQRLLDRAYAALLAHSSDFRVALAATGDAGLVHTVGKADPHETVLTEAELCERLMTMRAQLR